MKKLFIIFLIPSFVIFSKKEVSGQVIPERQWPGFRGYMASGILDNANLPDTFNIQKMINVRWKKEIPGLGLSCPAIWDNKLFITTAISQSDKAGFKP